mgnify:FL=1
MRSVDGHALRAVPSDGVGELHMLGHVVGVEGAVMPSRRVSDGDAAVSVHAAHRPRLSVGDAELGVVLAGRYLRACGDGVTVQPMRDSGGVDRTGVDQTLVHGMVDLLRGRVRRRDRDGGAAGLLLDSWGKRWGTEYVLARIAMHEGADIASRIDFMRFSVR